MNYSCTAVMVFIILCCISHKTTSHANKGHGQTDEFTNTEDFSLHSSQLFGYDFFPVSPRLLEDNCIWKLSEFSKPILSFIVHILRD